jgi:hypothetical protein
VYWRLEHPLLGLARLKELLAPGGVIVIEGLVLPGDEKVARFWGDELLDNDPTNWWTPTAACLESWLRALKTSHQGQNEMQPF